jgi:hypothetical protein
MLGDRSNTSAIQLVSPGTRNLKALALPCRLKCGFKIAHHETGGCDRLEVVQGKGSRYEEDDQHDAGHFRGR